VALTGDVDANIGFDAITVALLGRASPGGTVLAGILFGALRAGAVRMQAETGCLRRSCRSSSRSCAVHRGARPDPGDLPLRETRRRRHPAGEGVERMTAPVSATDEELVVVRHVVDVGVPLRTRLISGGDHPGRAGLHLRVGLRREPGDADSGCAPSPTPSRCPTSPSPPRDGDRARPDRGGARGVARRARVPGRRCAG
jgi:hypothetical protein